MEAYTDFYRVKNSIFDEIEPNKPNPNKDNLLNKLNDIEIESRRHLEAYTAHKSIPEEEIATFDWQEASR